jgi:hypothetical protein
MGKFAEGNVLVAADFTGQAQHSLTNNVSLYLICSTADSWRPLPHEQVLELASEGRISAVEHACCSFKR